MNKYRTAGLTLIVLALVLLVGINYLNNPKRRIPLVFSPKSLLSALWNSYKINILEAKTFRTLDKQRNNVTTSEGQSYTMLRAVWMDDKQTFDQSWAWTKDNLQHKSNDQLFSWVFGQLPNGQYGVLTAQGGNNTASDGDTDIALALIFASSRWGDQTYMAEAQKILDSVWNNEVVIINNKPYLAADNLEKSGKGDVLVNPSYLSPASYKIFAKADTKHDWNALADTSYDVIQNSAKANLEKKSSAGLPPDWIMLDRKTAAIKPAGASGLDSNFSYDALRVPFRLALDWQWFKDPRDQQILNSFRFLSTEWTDNKAIYSSYSHDGQTLQNTENPAMYGGTIGYFMVADPANASTIFDQKLKSLYNTDAYTWKQQPGYYEDNWAWFGIALYYQQLNNLYQQ
ncbi:MAG: glycosyl hydrolase family 8 [Acidobacteriaceae bacterium]